MDKHARTLMKTLSWRIAATSTTIILVFLLTGDSVLSAGVGSLEVVVKTVVYYIHERMWNMSNFGRGKPKNRPAMETPLRKKFTRSI